MISFQNPITYVSMKLLEELTTYVHMYVYQKFECTHTYVIIYKHTYVATYFILYTVHACKHSYFLGSFISFEDNGSSVSMLKTDVILHTTYYLLYVHVHMYNISYKYKYIQTYVIICLL